ncbi:MAG: glycosyltransferase family 4 protein [Acidobacteriota bacterium]
MSKLLFVVPTGHLDPASIKRVYDLRPFLEGIGYETEVISYRWEWLWSMRMRANMGSQSHRQLLWALNAARAMPRMTRSRDSRAKRRFADLVKNSDAVIVLQTSLDEEWRTILKETARRVIYDFDDAVWMSDEAGFAEMMRLSDEVVAGNKFLARRAATLNPRVSVIPTCVRLDRYEKATRKASNNGCVIGWVGSRSTVKYLEMIVEPLARLGEELDITFRVVGAGAAQLPQFRNVKVETHPSIPYDPVRFVPHFDIGVMPLADTEWERGKCGSKLLEYMAAGIPAVCSDVGENSRIIENSVTGFLTRDVDEWAAALRLLVDDSRLRQSIGLAGRERVRAAYSAEIVASLWRERLGGLPVSNAAENRLESL